MTIDNPSQPLSPETIRLAQEFAALPFAFIATGPHTEGEHLAWAISRGYFGDACRTLRQDIAVHISAGNHKKAEVETRTLRKLEAAARIQNATPDGAEYLNKLKTYFASINQNA